MGAIAHSQLARPDIAVCVSALQRHRHALNILNVTIGNGMVTGREQFGRECRCPTGTSYGVTHLRLHSDAAFKNDEYTGHSLRGAPYRRTSGNDDTSHTHTQTYHLLHRTA